MSCKSLTSSWPFLVLDACWYIASRLTVWLPQSGMLLGGGWMDAGLSQKNSQNSCFLVFDWWFSTFANNLMQPCVEVDVKKLGGSPENHRRACLHPTLNLQDVRVDAKRQQVCTIHLWLDHLRIHSHSLRLWFWVDSFETQTTQTSVTQVVAGSSKMLASVEGFGCYGTIKKKRLLASPHGSWNDCLQVHMAARFPTTFIPAWVLWSGRCPGNRFRNVNFSCPLHWRQYKHNICWTANSPTMLGWFNVHTAAAVAHSHSSKQVSSSRKPAMLELYDLLGFQSEPGKPNTVETPDNSTMHRLSAKRSHWSNHKKGWGQTHSWTWLRLTTEKHFLQGAFAQYVAACEQIRDTDHHIQILAIGESPSSEDVP